ncbi:hypothetical protein MRB53_009169 [Persea americana]|uniref:Uncharacterized protein n=1 Tax=Persea americana TaxID=3435 RepID=A0ACC2LN85_PERAE|nr:hypothetical protein MRB53_009169 [Persea americana]|eukprot:TRINITY_DN3896_c0_g1_i1.p1 TRINITY_DN3896_c0_g1~~TRINITY_DN3896_c0_g1_i1.p1  ORF type:complete len:113 (+),score=15.63 TRINITY_DN3896_c0_g1_i1:106-444(+)
MASNKTALDSTKPNQPPARTCLCSPTNHSGSFRCSLHRNAKTNNPNRPSTNLAPSHLKQQESKFITDSRSLKAILLQIIKPSSQDLRRRRNFQAKPTRFCLMDRNNHGVTVS